MNYNLPPRNNYPAAHNPYNPYQPLLQGTQQNGPQARRYPAPPVPPYQIPFQNQQRPFYPQLDPVPAQVNVPNTNRYPALPNPPNPVGPNMNSYPQLPNYAPAESVLSNITHQNQNQEGFGQDLLAARRIDKDFQNGKFKCYKAWLYFVFLFSTGFFIASIVGLFKQIPIILFYTGFGLSSWSMLQCMFGLKALRERSLAEANKAVWFMKGFILPLLILCVHLCFNIPSGRRHRGRHGHRHRGNQSARGLVIFFLVSAIISFLLHAFVTLNGARKIRNLLKKKEDILKGGNREEVLAINE